MSKRTRMNRPLRAITSTRYEHGLQIDRLDCGHVVEHAHDPFEETRATHRRCKPCGRTEAATTNETTGAV